MKMVGAGFHPARSAQGWAELGGARERDRNSGEGDSDVKD